LEVRPDGSRYEGEWTRGKRQGDGIETSPNGSIHDGVWENNMPLGPGTRHLSTGIEITGLWNGDFVTAGILTLPGNAEYAGNLYDKNNSVVSADLTAWLTKAGSAGNHHAQLMLGDVYSKYVEPPQDLAKAKEWYRRAARGDVPEAMYRIGAILIEQNQPATGVKYLARASDADHPMANLLLGSYYQLGNHVGKDHARARSLYQHATDRGNVVARNNLAWLLATSPNDRVRDGKKAVGLIRPIAYLYNNWGYYDTLAAAFAEAGDFSAAKSAQALAIRLAESDSASPDSSVILAMRGRLSLFEAEVAYREN
jgi:TPR repeat protein